MRRLDRALAKSGRKVAVYLNKSKLKWNHLTYPRRPSEVISASMPQLPDVWNPLDPMAHHEYCTKNLMYIQTTSFMIYDRFK
jgi:hypothetical protein